MVGLQIAVGLGLGLSSHGSFLGLRVRVDAVIKKPSLERTGGKTVGQLGAVRLAEAPGASSPDERCDVVKFLVL